MNENESTNYGARLIGMLWGVRSASLRVWRCSAPGGGFLRKRRSSARGRCARSLLSDKPRLGRRRPLPVTDTAAFFRIWAPFTHLFLGQLFVSVVHVWMTLRWLWNLARSLQPVSCEHLTILAAAWDIRNTYNNLRNLPVGWRIFLPLWQ